MGWRRFGGGQADFPSPRLKPTGVGDDDDQWQRDTIALLESNGAVVLDGAYGSPDEGELVPSAIL